MSRSHQNGFSQPHQQNWFMSPNLLNALFSNSSNPNNMNNGVHNNVNHISNLLNAQGQFFPTNLANNSNHSQQSYSSYSHNYHQASPQSGNNAQFFMSHNYGGNGNNVQVNPNSSALNNARYMNGHHNNYHNNQSRTYNNHRSSRHLSNSNHYNSDTYYSRRYHPSNNTNLLNMNTNSTNNNVASSYYTNKSGNHMTNTMSVKSYNPKCQYINDNLDQMKHSSSQYYSNNTTKNSHHIQVKGMENIRLDNETSTYKFNSNMMMQTPPRKLATTSRHSKYNYDSSNNSSEISFNNKTIIKEEIVYYKSEIMEHDRIIYDTDDNNDVQFVQSVANKATTSSFTQTIDNPTHSSLSGSVSNAESNYYPYTNCCGKSVYHLDCVTAHKCSNMPQSSLLTSSSSSANYSHMLVNATSSLMDQLNGASTNVVGGNVHNLLKPQITPAISKQAQLIQPVQTNEQQVANISLEYFNTDLTSINPYHDWCSHILWDYYVQNRQTELMYVRKVQLRNALHMVMSYVFENAGLFIVGSSMNGFGVDNSDMDLCLTISNKELDQKKEAFVVLHQLLEPLRKCSFIKNLHLVRANVPILKFRDSLAGVDCDLNINNVVGIYNTHLMAMYNRIDWRVRPLGMYIKNWAQKQDLHDASRGRLSTYTLILMVIHYLQAGTYPAILPSLQMKYPKYFGFDRDIKDVDMRLELPWDELRSSNTASLSELFMGFFEYYSEKFNFSQMVVSVRQGKPLPIDVAIKQLPAHEQFHNVQSFKMFIEEPFSLTNVARSLFDNLVFSRVKDAFRHTLQIMRMKQPLRLIFFVPNTNEFSSQAAIQNHESNDELTNSTTSDTDFSIQAITATDENDTDNALTILENDNDVKIPPDNLDDPSIN